MDSDDRVQRESLLRRAVLAGDEEAWRRWYDETFDELYRYVLWRMGGRSDLADEVVQETWLTAVRNIRRFQPARGRFHDWLCGLAANVIRHTLRQTERRKKREQAGREVGSGSPCEDREWQDQIAATLGSLPARQEAALRAKYVEGLSVAEIAAMWNESPKTVESLLSRARQAFRELYDR